MNRILVTGSQGQLGRSLNEISGDYPELEFYFTDKEDLDITKADKVESYFSEHAIDGCLNAAAFTDVDGAERSPKSAFEVNATGVKNLAFACRKHDVFLIHISTDYVFDGEKEGGYLPNDTPNPINVYGASKLQGENYIQHILEHYVIIRTSWLYSEYGKNFYTTIRKKLIEEESIGVTGLQKGCPTHARDLARYILNWWHDPDRRYGILHYAGEDVMTWYEFAQKIAREHDPVLVEKIVKDDNYRSFAARPANSVLLAS